MVHRVENRVIFCRSCGSALSGSGKVLRGTECPQCGKELFRNWSRKKPAKFGWSLGV
jgi:hypothetical protein